MKQKNKNKTVVVIGSFDGVHRGHHAIFQSARSAADATGYQCLCLTFYPHPKHIVDPDSAPRLLSLPDEKDYLARQRGIDEVVTMPFTPTLANTSAEQFAEDVLAEKLNAQHLVIGYDFGFGRGREGNAEFLQEWGAKRGITVTVVNAIKINGEPVSSTRIRRLINSGQFARGLTLLGHHYPIFGHIGTGEGRGRSLGYPTMNLSVTDDKLLPPIGVYAARIEIDAVLYGAMAYIGTKPTFGQHPLGVEIHVFDYPGDRPTEAVQTWFTHWVRPDQRFDSESELKKQLARDEVYVRELLEHL